MAGLFHARLGFLVVLCGLFEGVIAVDDFTCVTKPIVGPSEETFIAGFFVNLDGTLSFARTQHTKTVDSALTLPTDSNLDPTALRGDVSVSVLRMPASGGISRIGVYGCQATMAGGSLTSIGTVIMNTQADFEPTAISQTVNLGEEVRLTVTAAATGQQSTRWRKDSSNPIASSNGNLYYDIIGASNTHAGTYEVHRHGVRGQGKQALMRLLVRGCGRDTWGRDTECNRNCPICFNGGVCDDVSGVCICGPGFSGTFCEILLGPNRFGQSGSLRCDSEGLPSRGSTCRGMLFCLPDPYGCSCAAGYQGLDCRKAPSSVTLFRAVAPSTSPTQIHLAWKFVSNLCAVERYQIEYELTNQDQCKDIPSLRVEVTSDLYAESVIISSGLLPFSSYTVYIKAWNEIGAGPETSISVTTGETVPEVAPVLNRTDPSSNSIQVLWDRIPCGNRRGTITYYECKVEEDARRVITEWVTAGAAAVESVTFNDLSPCTSYTVQVRAHTRDGGGPWMEPALLKTSAQEPVIAVYPKATPLLPTKILVTWSWQNPNNNDCMADELHIEYQLKNHDQCIGKTLSQDRQMLQSVDISATQTTISGLEPYSTYRVHITSVSAGERQESSVEVTTLGTEPSGHPTVVTPSEVTDTTISFSWNLPECGKVNSGNSDSSDDNSGSSDGNSGSSSGAVVGVMFTLLVIVVAAVLVVIFIIVIMLLSKVDLQNVQPTLSSTKIHSAGGSFAETYKPSASPSDSTSKPSKSTETGSPTNRSTADTSTSTKAPIKPKPYNKSQHKVHGTAKSASAAFTWPVAMAELAGYIKSRKTGKISGFQQDFETFSTEPTKPQIVAKKEENKKKNRYHNILPYDHSRVTLEILDGDPNSDYVNASYINGYKKESKYIACQGPNQTSLNDLWRMIWQERVGKIVMLTNLVEKGKEKCVQYWPKEYSQDYGDFLVIKSDEKVSLNFVLRSFDVSRISDPDGEYRKIVQFHYTKWPDMKPPESSSLLQFIRQVQISESSQDGPIIAHCSAGVGRTGTYIALDAMLEQARAEGQVDVLNFVREMRDKRYLMVQTQAQFKFIYEALLESSLSENTAISVDRFRQDYAKLKKRDKKTGTNGMEDQFQMLETFTASMGDDQCAGAKHPANVDKNRFQKCVPKDSTRPYLMTEGDTGSTNYINATFLDGSKGKHSYIATQAPLPCTLDDIWRLVFDYKSSCIIMLNSVESNVPQYWPEEDAEIQVGPLTVKLKSVDQQTDDMIVRQFTIFKKSEDMQTVCHIQFLQWPSGKDIPSSPPSLLKVLATVKMWTQEHPDGPLTVQCIDGEGCSGTFCTLVTLLDRLEQDGVIDVFQAVKKLRSTRAGMVKTLAQYQLCYQLIKLHLDSASSSSIYENLGLHR
ncbi:receptor-type tyrosine-protein phosphatase alpha-like [Asterias rubens]|uniref:receptor-type tyrosine-protein phosphatase alpha-like n=1 Tax=Asterias rubens TaxID=7604 RepID=UPI00145572C7|nr:receptor-type tyrosine-protein phosphatase alpha-like [Asterias rubens]